MAFYTAKAIQPEIPAILAVRQGVVLSRATMSDLYSTGEGSDRDIADLIEVLLEETSRPVESAYDVVLLTSPEDPQTLKLSRAIQGTKKDRRGRPIPITMGQYRYVNSESLAAGPDSTDELEL